MVNCLVMLMLKTVCLIAVLLCGDVWRVRVWMHSSVYASGCGLVRCPCDPYRSLLVVGREGQGHTSDDRYVVVGSDGRA